MRIIPVLHFTFALILLPLVAAAQLSANVDNLYNSLREFDSIETSDSQQFAMQVNFDNGLARISGMATDPELVHIAHTGSGALKQYAINTLISRKSSMLIPLFSEFITFNEAFSLRDGDKTIETNAAIELYKGVMEQKEILARKQYYERTLNATELGEMRVLFGSDFDTDWTAAETDSLGSVLHQVALANDNIDKKTLGWILAANNFAATDYERIRFFANKYQSSEILAALASFRNVDDVSFIVAHFECGLQAVAKFPHPHFFRPLSSASAISYELPDFQNAVAAFKNPAAANLLAKIHGHIAANYKDRDTRDQKLLELYNIVENYTCKAYEPILKKLQNY